MAEYVVRKMLQYVHGFKVGTKWLGTDCHGVVENVRWTNLQRFAFRFADRNAAASTAMDLDAYVVKLRPKCGATAPVVHKHRPNTACDVLCGFAISTADQATTSTDRKDTTCPACLRYWVDPGVAKAMAGGDRDYSGDPPTGK